MQQSISWARIAPKNPGYVFVQLLLIQLVNMVCASVVLAAAPIQTRMLGTMEYESKIDAIKALGHKFLADSITEDVEYMGAILKTPTGTYRVSHGKSRPGQNRFHFTVLRPESLTVIAYWHTHGAHGDLRDKFSVTDTQTVIKTGLPFYLITPAGGLKMLNLSETRGRQTSTQTIKRDIRQA
jgi:hypothetical protein